MIHTRMDNFFHNVRTGNLDQVKDISRRIDLNVQNIDGHTALHIACKIGYMEMITFLITRGANINVQDCKGNTPLHMLVINRNNVTEIIDYLVENGADLEVQNMHRDTPLLSALKNAHAKAAEYLVKKGSNIHVKGDGNETTLLWACKLGKDAHPMIRLFVELGIDVNEPDYGSLSTPLYFSVYHEDITLTSYLLSKGADPAHEIFDGTRVVDCAKSKEIKTLLEFHLGENLLAI